jgi:hypothetical protein
VVRSNHRSLSNPYSLNKLEETILYQMRSITILMMLCLSALFMPDDLVPDTPVLKEAKDVGPAPPILARQRLFQAGLNVHGLP